MDRFVNRVVLISGGSRGLGEAQARQIVAEGGKVVIGDVLVEEGRRLAAELGPACSFLKLDVTDEAQWDQAVALSETIGPLHGLVNNAGVFAPLGLMETDVAQFERHMRINQLGTFIGMRAVTPALERTGAGSIVNISSSAGLRARPNTLAYTGTKWAVRGMTKAAALELAGRKIRVNSVHPGPIDTDMLKMRGFEDFLRNLERIPMKRMGTAAEVARVVLFLLSDDSSYMTGSELAVDGGVTL
jgi:3alpha(or 20beta)-hydroxysteroid dehydrogenase